MLRCLVSLSPCHKLSHQSAVQPSCPDQPGVDVMHCILGYPPAGTGPLEPQNGLGRPGSPCHQEAAQHTGTVSTLKPKARVSHCLMPSCNEVEMGCTVPLLSMSPHACKMFCKSEDALAATAYMPGSTPHSSLWGCLHSAQRQKGHQILCKCSL